MPLFLLLGLLFISDSSKQQHNGEVKLYRNNDSSKSYDRIVVGWRCECRNKLRVLYNLCAMFKYFPIWLVMGAYEIIGQAFQPSQH